MRIALANLPFPRDANDALDRVIDVAQQASANGASIICTPENYIPGLRGVGFAVDPVDPMFLDVATVWLTRVARSTSITIVAGMGRVSPSGLVSSALVASPSGILGWQDKVQIDPSEEGIYVAGRGRRLFEVSGLRFGVCLCHEGRRYPETVRWAARRGAQIVLNPQFSPALLGSAPRLFCEPSGTFHAKAAICRAVENDIYWVVDSRKGGQRLVVVLMLIRRASQIQISITRVVVSPGVPRLMSYEKQIGPDGVIHRAHAASKEVKRPAHLVSAVLKRLIRKDAVQPDYLGLVVSRPLSAPDCRQVWIGGFE